MTSGVPVTASVQSGSISYYSVTGNLNETYRLSFTSTAGVQVSMYTLCPSGGSAPVNSWNGTFSTLLLWSSRVFFSVSTSSATSVSYTLQVEISSNLQVAENVEFGAYSVVNGEQLYFSYAVLKMSMQL